MFWQQISECLGPGKTKMTVTVSSLPGPRKKPLNVKLRYPLFSELKFKTLCNSYTIEK